MHPSTEFLIWLFWYVLLKIIIQTEQLVAVVAVAWVSSANMINCCFSGTLSSILWCVDECHCVVAEKTVYRSGWPHFALKGLISKICKMYLCVSDRKCYTYSWVENTGAVYNILYLDTCFCLWCIQDWKHKETAGLALFKGNKPPANTSKTHLASFILQISEWCCFFHLTNKHISQDIKVWLFGTEIYIKLKLHIKLKAEIMFSSELFL